MKIEPNDNDLANWAACVPRDGDLLFFTHVGAKEFTELPSALHTREQVKAQGLKIWSLNARSWYGYALNQAEYCTWLPTGALEILSPAQKSRLAEEQLRLNVPTVIDNHWLTSKTWSELSKDKQIEWLKRWMLKNEIHIYQGIQLDELPPIAKKELKKIGYDHLLNHFSSQSGPNCFAAAAGALVKENKPDFYNQWMHWPQLNQILGELDFAEVQRSEPQPGDVLLFSKDLGRIHGAYYLGDGYYFEKPGQDFYEPYRVDLFSDWKTNWPDTQLSIWRKR